MSNELTFPSVSILTANEADRYFQELSVISGIPFNYPDDCCFSRAHAMCRILRSRNIIPRKIWKYGSGWMQHATLWVRTKNHPDGIVWWTYHVAPVIAVQGVAELCYRVIDPSLFNRHVSIAEWDAIQNDPAGIIRFSDDDVYFCEPNGAHAAFDCDHSQTTKRLKLHRRRRNDRLARLAKPWPLGGYR